MTDYLEEDTDIKTNDLNYDKKKYKENYNIVSRQVYQTQPHARVEVCLTDADVTTNTGCTQTKVVPNVVIIGVAEAESADTCSADEYQPSTFTEMCLLWTVENPRMLCLLIIVVSFGFTFLLTFLQYFT